MTAKKVVHTMTNTWTTYRVSSHQDRQIICDHLKKLGFVQGSLITPADFSAGISTDDGLFVQAEEGKKHDEIVKAIDEFLMKG